jgi:hypothetical protein
MRPVAIDDAFDDSFEDSQRQDFLAEHGCAPL